MARTSVSVPNCMQEEMKKHPEINWSGVFQDAVSKRLGLEDDEKAPSWFMAFLRDGLERIRDDE